MLDAVRRESKVAWILLGNATVDSLTDGVLTLRFAKEGEAKGFSGSGYDQDLGRVLQTMLGAAPQIRATAADRAARVHRLGRPARAAPDEASPGTAPAAGRARPRRAAPGQQTGASAAGRGRPARRRPGRSSRPARLRRRHFPETPAPHRVTGRARPGTRGSESLTGIDLIQRELGGKVIEELGDG